jgi:hypothetical protein
MRGSDDRVLIRLVVGTAALMKSIIGYTTVVLLLLALGIIWAYVGRALYGN